MELPRPAEDAGTPAHSTAARNARTGFCETNSMPGAWCGIVSIWIANPDTGKRVSRPNPKTAWHEKDVPQLAIVDRGLFDAAQKRKAERSIGHPTHQRRPKHILSGLLRCGACGGGMSASGKDKSGRRRIYCTAARESGT